MVGITSYGVYIPLYRLARAEISQAWGGPSIRGEKAVANYDEDSLTMAVAACMDCVKDIDPHTVDNLYFASASPPYGEKQSAAIITVAVDLRRDAFTTDLSHSLRGGTSAIRAALDAVNSKSAKSALVCAADTRLGMPNGANELAFGDGAAALLLGDTGVIATIDGSYSINDEIVDVWRPEGGNFVHNWEERFVREEGYTKVVPEAVSGALNKYKLAPKDFAKAVFYAPNPRLLSMVARKLGFDVKTQIQDLLYDQMGNTGTALPLMLLGAALEEAKAGDKILLVSYGDGSDVYILTVTEEIGRLKGKRGMKEYLASKRVLPSYQKYLQWQSVIPIEPPSRPPLQKPSAVALWRDSKTGLGLYGSKCKKCGTPQIPLQRVCVECQAKDDFELYRFAERKGTVYTFSQDNLAASPDPPSTITAVDFEGGGRLMCDMTDRDPKTVKVGMPVEMTFRKLRDVGGIQDYWWKCRPVR